MMNTVCVMAHKENFFSLKGLLGNFIREIDYPTKEDPAYLIRAEVPESNMATIRTGILELTGKSERR